MKRSAENQLTKDGQYDEEEEIEEIEGPGQGFQRADEGVLAKRQIRALPKRTMSGAASKAASFNGVASSPASPPDADKETSSSSKFGGFAGFGAGPSSNPFTFTAVPSSTLGSAGPDTRNKSVHQSFGTFKATVQPLAPGAVNLFPDGAQPTKNAPPSRNAMSNATEDGGSSALKYYKSLRGLNISFLSAISKAVEQDPFVDVTGLLESYKSLRTTVQSEFDSSQSTKSTNTPLTDSSSILGAKDLASEKPGLSTSSFALPKASATFTGFGAPPSTTSKSASESAFTFGFSTTNTNGFSFPITAPSAPSTQLPFSLTSKPSESPASTSAPEPPKAAFTFGTSASDDFKSQKPLGLSFTTPSTTAGQARSIFGSSTKDTDVSVTTAPSSQPAPTTSVFGSTSVPNFFANSKASGITPSDPSISGSGPGDTIKSSPFSSSTSNSSKMNDKADAPKDASNSQTSTSLFGGTTTGTSAPSSVILPPDKTVSAFGSSSPPKTSIFGFGKPGGSIGNPVGFGFGGPTSQGDRPGPSSGFAFGAQLSKPADNASTTDKSTESTPQPENNEGGEDEPARLLPTGNHDEEGEGEEDEETMHVVKCKVFRLMKSEDKSEWKDFGVGMLRLKKDKQTSARRVLMRNSSTGRILINFRLYNGLRPTLAKTSVSFIGHDNGAPASFRIRIKTEEQAAGLKEAMDREIAAFQSAE